MSSYRNNYNNSSDYNYGTSSGYSNNSYSNNNIPPSRRPDGSYREEVRVRPGHVPEAERQYYVPPPARKTNYSGYSGGATTTEPLKNNSEDRIDSWADLDAPVLSEHSEYESNDIEESTPTKVEVEKEPTESTETTESTESQEPEPSGSPAPSEPRKPSQLAAAIDTALDSLSINSSSGDSGAPRPIGRFAAQIASDEREGRSYTPRRYDSSYSNRNDYSRGDYNNNNRSDYQGYNRDYRGNTTTNWNRNPSYSNSYSSNRDNTDEAASSGSAAVDSSNNLGTSSGLGNSSGDIRAEKEFKSFLEQLNALRREMAVINAKLEYIRYFKHLDLSELNDSERARLIKEKDLLARMDAIFEAIEALALKH